MTTEFHIYSRAFVRFNDGRTTSQAAKLEGVFPSVDEALAGLDTLARRHMPGWRMTWHTRHFQFVGGSRGGPEGFVAERAARRVTKATEVWKYYIEERQVPPPVEAKLRPEDIYPTRGNNAVYHGD